jgi:ketosteroid isomerase-like protein
MSEEAAVLFANDTFYNAFTTRDLRALEELWSREVSVVCVHPGWAPLLGRDAVMESWAAILSGPSSPDIACRQAKAHFLSDDICFVTCYELIGDGALVATNIFVKEATGWRLVHHQASPAAGPPSDPGTRTSRRLQ